ncbi:hypothetical protein METBIDRAFT_43010 [Metschnikowia bicuspidata var. bicuspidata NRRL YB-4993]|uniref:Uncharacterized protein n=1 Tax=Metschnikowia bicuspidata var. bicuspidata NRRL YB-4993 TaxID=869754 RepID=A0A1A0H835_9ASCO|nr:hypothetical protein METBIDRAFT_43010 [Metschnikowia bicuspidata var. bicuspidata NRRL YB-4993]OBA20181.1 hypothetical protein METBIDRAFT_43010 [Metschnikowia bicuspidata var. bicuspidata NRRL YB-4993]
MPKKGRSVATDPSSFTHRDLLLVTQLLHTLGLITLEQVQASDRLDDLAEDWYVHKSTLLSRRQGQFPLENPPTGQQLRKLYENMLEDNEPCATTTDLANKFYFIRVGELESRISEYKTEFHSLLEN